MISGICFAENSNSYVPEKVQSQAQEFLNLARKLILQDPDLWGWGFSNEKELENLKLGPVFKMKEMDVKKLKNYYGNSIHDVLKPTEKWQYIVYSDNSAKIVMTIGLKNGEYILTSCSGKGKAVAYDAVFKHYQSTNYSKLHNRPIIVESGAENLLVIENGNKELAILIKPLTPYTYKDEYQVDDANYVEPYNFEPAEKILKQQKRKYFDIK